MSDGVILVARIHDFEKEDAGTYVHFAILQAAIAWKFETIKQF